jgi:hypothetical protein
VLALFDLVTAAFAQVILLSVGMDLAPEQPPNYHAPFPFGALNTCIRDAFLEKEIVSSNSNLPRLFSAGAWSRVSGLKAGIE